MSTLGKTTFATLLLASLVPSATWGQSHVNQSRGFDTRGVFQLGDVDAINLFNGALTVTIPLGSQYPVGPSSYGFALVYNSNAWSVREVCNPPTVGTNPVFFHAYVVQRTDAQGNVQISIDPPPLGWAPRDDWSPRQGNGCANLSLPHPASNAGLGWQLNLGRLLAPRGPEHTSRWRMFTEGDEWLYVGPDGSEHAFFGGDPATAAGTTDGSFLRLRPLTGAACPPEVRACWAIDFPDGSTETFYDFGPAADQPDFRLVRRADAFGNGFTVSYQDFQGSSAWTVTDTEGRIHRLEFSDEGGEMGPVLTRLELAAFGGAKLEIDLRFEVPNVLRGAPHNDPGPPGEPISPSPAIPLLTAVEFRQLGSADLLSRWSMEPAQEAYDFRDLPPDHLAPPQIRGVLRRLTLPSGGRLEWTFGSGYRYPTGIGGRRGNRSSTGVRERRRYNVTGAEIARWSYQPALSQLTAEKYAECGDLAIVSGEGYPWRHDCHEKHFQVTVTDPEQNRTVHHFSVYALPRGEGPTDPIYTPEGWDRKDYGLPFTRLESVDGLFLSSELYPAGATTPARKTYLRYERDTNDYYMDGWGADLKSNDRVAAERVVYLDDGGRFKETLRSDYDGYRHYRRTITRSGGGWKDGSGATDSFRTSFTQYTPDPALWQLGLFTEQWSEEAGRRERAEFHFGSVPGAPPTARALLRTRRLAGTSGARGLADVVTVHTFDTRGNLTSEKTYGGDLQPQMTDTDLASLNLAGLKAGFAARHLYASGVRRGSWVVDDCRGSDFLRTLDADIDASTGLARRVRDAAKVATDFSYDVLGRQTLVNPVDRPEAQTRYQYLLHSSSQLPEDRSGAQVVTTVGTCSGSTCLHWRRTRLTFDGLGRLVAESRDLPSLDTPGQTATANRYFAFNGLGWTTKEWTWRYGNNDFRTLQTDDEPSHFTHYQGFDAFGRATAIVPPDGAQHTVGVTYTGDRLVQRRIQVATLPNGGETEAKRTELYDALGRLVEVTEPSGSGNTSVTTTYRYDVGNRLIEAVSAPSSGSQRRAFEYDGRGFLERETHPEIGPSGIGSVSYGGYDAQGKPAWKWIEGTSGDNLRQLFYHYDAAGRVIEVWDGRTGPSDPEFKPLQQFFYATVNLGAGESNRQAGKLVRTRRFHPEQNLWVVEDYRYEGLGGRMSAMSTKLVGTATVAPRFEQTYTYTPLGELESLSYPRCTTPDAACQAATPARVLTFGYDRGQLASVPGVANKLQYSAHGGLRLLEHTNGVVETITNDPTGLARPQSIAVTAPGGVNLWNSGFYGFDGAGNIWKMGAQRFQYDKVSRLVDAQVRWQGSAVQGRETLTYDAFGNILTRTTNTGSAAPPAVNPATNRLAAGIYDAAGNLLSWGAGSPQLTFDRLDQVTQRQDGPTTWQYLYTTGGERVLEKNPATGLLRWTLRGPGNQVLRILEQRADGTWAFHRDHFFAGSRLLASEGPAGAASRVHYHTDHLGSTRLETNAAGQAIKYRDYLPFGEALATPGTTDHKLLFTGHQRDDVVAGSTADDLDYMHARYCSPGFGRFLSVDPVLGSAASPQSWNRYAYVRGNPVGLVDPDGRSASAGVGIAAAVTVGVTLFFVAEAANGPRLDPPDKGIPNSDGGAQLNAGLAMVAGEAAFARFVAPAAGWLWKTTLGRFFRQAAPDAGDAAAAAAPTLQGAAGTTVYRSVNAAGEVQYVGITNNLARRAAEHLRSGGIEVEKLLGGLSRSEAKAVEQALIEIHVLSKNGGTLLNRINSIAPSNPAYAQQLQQGHQLLQSIGYP